MPSELLRRRPDIRKAEAEHHAATARIGVAEADRYPNFSITGSAFLTSSALSSWSDVMKSFGPGAGIQWNFLSFGRNRAKVEQARAKAAESVLVYRETVLNALHDVEKAWSALEKERSREKALTNALAMQGKALKLSQELYEVGKGDYLDVLTAQASYLSAQKDLASHSANIALDAVTLIQALGGGWNGIVEGEASFNPPPPRDER